MDVRSFFNAMLLSLSLATMLISLIAFVIYKLKQLANKGKFEPPYHLESTFFKRYAPRLEVLNLEAFAKSKKSEKKVSFRVTSGLLLVIATLTIAVLLTAQLYLADYMERRKKINVVQNFKQLLDMGLMKKYDFLPKIKKDAVVTHVPVKDKEIRNFLVDNLRKKQIVIYNPDYSSPLTQASQQRWIQFLEQFRLPYVVSGFSGLTQVDVFIMPNVEYLSPEEKTRIERLKNGSRIGMLFTGVQGMTQAQQRDNVKNDYAEKVLGLRYRACPQEGNFPTIFSASVPPWWSVPVGFQSKDLNQDGVCAEGLNRKEIPVAFESDFEGHVRFFDANFKKSILRGYVKTEDKRRSAWISFDPMNWPGEMGAVNPDTYFYEEQTFLTLLAYLAEAPVYRWATFKNPTNFQVVFGIGPVEEVKEAESAVKLFMEKNIPFTFFAKPEQVQNVKEMFRILKNEKNDYDVAIYEDPFTSAGKKEGEIDKNDFFRIQNSRMELEEYFAKRIKGLKVKEGKADDSLTFAALTNRLQYLFQSRFPFHPQYFTYEGRDFIYLPVISNGELSNRFSFATSYSNAFVKEYGRLTREAKLLHRPLYLTIGQDFFPKMSVLKTIRNKLLDKKTSVYSVDSYYDRQVRHFRTSLLMTPVYSASSTEETGFDVQLENRNGRDLNDVTLLLDDPNLGEIKFSRGVNGLKWNQSGDLIKMDMKKIENGASLRLTFESENP